MTTNNPEEDIEASIANIDTDMGLDLEFDGEFVTDYYSSTKSIYNVENKPNGKSKPTECPPPSSPEDTKDSTQ